MNHLDIVKFDRAQKPPTPLICKQWIYSYIENPTLWSSAHNIEDFAAYADFQDIPNHVLFNFMQKLYADSDNIIPSFVEALLTRFSPVEQMAIKPQTLLKIPKPGDDIQSYLYHNLHLGAIYHDEYLETLTHFFDNLPPEELDNHLTLLHNIVHFSCDNLVKFNTMASQHPILFQYIVMYVDRSVWCDTSHSWRSSKNYTLDEPYAMYIVLNFMKSLKNINIAKMEELKKQFPIQPHFSASHFWFFGDKKQQGRVIQAIIPVSNTSAIQSLVGMVGARYPQEDALLTTLSLQPEEYLQHMGDMLLDTISHEKNVEIELHI